MLRFALSVIWLAAGLATAQASAKAPVVDGNVTAVSNADVQAAMAEIRRTVNLYRKSLDLRPTDFYVGIYRVRVIDHNTMWIYRYTSEGRTPTRVIMQRMKGKWQTTTVGVVSVYTPNHAMERTADCCTPHC